MFSLKFKQISSAISDGQLDEAYRLVIASEDIDRHRRGQKLSAKLAKAFVRRGGEHLVAERHSFALNDCNKADRLGGNRTEIAELRKAVCKAMEQKQYAHQQRSQKLRAAQEQIDDGWLSVGEDILGDVQHDQANVLRIQADTLRKKIDAAVEKVELALKRDDMSSAIELLSQVANDARANTSIAELSQKVKTMAVAQVTDNVNGGKIEAADRLLSRIESFDRDGAAVADLRQAVNLCKEAASLVDSGNCREAGGVLSKVKLLFPSAKWVNESISKCNKAAEAIDGLCSGPLGLVSDAAVVESSPAVTNEPAKSRPVQAGVIDVPAVKLPSKFVVQIDGVGGFLTVRDDRVSIGPVSSSARPVLALMAGAHIPTATIERNDGDYVLQSGEPIHVGERRITEKVLSDGDKIALSDRCRLKFGKPNAASGSATLQLSSAKLARPDINHVILMDREILVGAGEGNHIRAAAQSLAFYVRDEQMYCRTEEAVVIDGKSVSTETALPMDKTIEIGQMRVVLVSA